MKRMADGGSRGCSETSFSTFCKRPHKASGSRSLPLTRSLRIVERSSVPSIYRALLETKQLPEREPATLPIVQSRARSLWKIDRFDRIFRYTILALIYRLHGHCDLRTAVVRHREQVEVVSNT